MKSFFNLKVKALVKETDDATSIYLKQPLLKKVKYKPGQFLTLIVNIDGTEQRRAYSLNTCPKVDNNLSVTVKRVKGGKVSNFLIDHLKVGQSLRIMEPMGNFVHDYDQNQARNIILFGGGSGITPLMSIAKSALYFEKESRVTLFYANQRPDRIIFKRRLDELQDQFPDNFDVFHILEAGEIENTIHKGKLNAKNIGPLLSQVNYLSNNHQLFYMCGPAGMMDQVRSGLKENGIDEENIFQESFNATLPLPSYEKSESSSQIRIINLNTRGKNHQIRIKPKVSILDAVLDQGVEIPYSCMNGICGTCKAKCKTGEVDMKMALGLTADEKEKNYILTCVSYPKSDDINLEV